MIVYHRGQKAALWYSLDMKEIDKDIQEIRSRTFGYVSAALGLVAGLAWNEAITGLINILFPIDKNTVAVKFLYAIIITGVVVLLIRYLDRFLNRQEAGK